MQYKEEYRQTPNKGMRNLNTCLGLVLHHSADTYEQCIRVCLNDKAPKRVSYHAVVNVNGDRTVFADDTAITWHAGKSSFMGINGSANNCTIGLAWTGDTALRLPTVEEIESALEFVLPRFYKYKWTSDRIKTHGEVALPLGRKVDCSLRWKQIFVDFLLQKISPR